MKKIAVGMSGGVDSSVAAALLKDNGYDVSGVTLCLLADDDGSCSRTAASVCQKLGIPHTENDLIDKFKQTVIDDFTAQYLRGNTPNPCIVCNKHIKFGAFLDIALGAGCDGIATGHYARIEKQGQRHLLKVAADPTKDQSYVLYCLSQHQLSKLLLPLGEFSKSEVRSLAEDYGFCNAKQGDSQDICFVPDGNYARFIEKLCGAASAGYFVDTSGNVMGRNSGHIHYTIGQRRGLGISAKKRLFVLDKDALTGRVVLGDEDSLFKKRVLIKDINLIPFDSLHSDLHIECKLRYRHTAQPAIIHPIGDNSAVIEFEQPQRAPTPGQAAVFYDGEFVVGGGTIIGSE